MLSMSRRICSMASSGMSQMNVAFLADEKCSASRFTATQSWYLVTAQNPGPSGSSCQ